MGVPIHPPTVRAVLGIIVFSVAALLILAGIAWLMGKPPVSVMRFAPAILVGSILNEIGFNIRTHFKQTMLVIIVLTVVTSLL